MDEERRERAQEIKDRLRMGDPLKRIFPLKGDTLVLPPPLPVPEGRAHFVASDIGGDPVVRHYVLDCEHANSELDLVRTPEQDGDVLGGMLRNHRATVASRGGLCLCDPIGWSRA